MLEQFNSRWAILPLEDTDMIRMNTYYFYHIGSVIHPLRFLKDGAVMTDIIADLYVARDTLVRLFDGFYPLRACTSAGEALHEAIDDVINQYSAEKMEKLSFGEAYTISSAAIRFETILGAEMQTLDTYHASQKALYKTEDLIERAEIVLPEGIRSEVPDETINEIRHAGRCLAFELPTAMGFHIVRATEAVIREYYRVVVGTVPKVKARNWGSYIKFLKAKGADGKIITVLEQIKNTYRNPIVHPEDVLEIEDAIILFGMAQGVIVSMVKDIVARKAAAGKAKLTAVPATAS